MNISRLLLRTGFLCEQKDHQHSPLGLGVKLLSLLYRKMPEKESDHLTPATRLLEKRREMSEVEQALATQKEVFQIQFNATWF